MEQKILSAGVIVVRREGDSWRYLVLRVYGYWDFPKGIVEPDEDPIQAACREVEEETGVGELMFSWGFTRKPAHFSASLFPGPRTWMDLSERCQLVEGFQSKFPDHETLNVSNRGTFEFIIDPIVGTGIERRLRAFVSSVVTGLQPDKQRELRTFFRLENQYNDDENRYTPVP